jgi:hypothetical protein
VPAAGGEARAIGQAPVGMFVSWSPGRHILFQTAGNRSYNLLDPLTLVETPLLSREVGYVFDACASRDDERVLVYLNRDDRQGGLWSISAAGGEPRLLALHMRPLGYSPDGRTIYAADLLNSKVFLVPADGGPPSHPVALPFDKPALQIAHIPGTRSFLYAIDASDSDIWLMENFDPEAAVG